MPDQDALIAAYPAASTAIRTVVLDRGELTLHVAREHIARMARVLRDNPALRGKPVAVGHAAKRGELTLELLYHRTADEAGVKGFDVRTWAGLLVSMK